MPSQSFGSLQPPSLSSVITSAWSGIHQRVLGATSVVCKMPLCSVAETAAVSLLRNITLGCLVIRTPSRTYRFPTSSASETKQCENAPQAELTVHSPIFWLRLCATGDVGFAEGFMYGEVDCDDLMNVFSVFLANRSCLSAIDTPLARLLRVPQRLAAARLVNSVANARNNISAHYDISNDMFQGFLSKDMTYSCAIFPDLDGDLDRSTDSPRYPSSGIATPELAKLGSPLVLSPSSSSNSVTGSSTPSTLVEFPHQRHTQLDSHGGKLAYARGDHGEDGALGPGDGDDDELHAAQLRKLQHIVRKADIRPGHRVLEIGSGWGSLAIYIAATVPGTTVDTLTLSVQQATLARERIRAVGLGAYPDDGAGGEVEGWVRVHLMDYRSMPPEWEGAFDRVVSVEMVEAVGRAYLETYWQKIDWALKKDTGVGVVQGITIPEARLDAYMRDTDFIRKWDAAVFPGGFLPSLTLLLESLTRATHGRLVVDSVSNIGPHYARTLREWRRRFEACFEDVIVPALKKEHPHAMDDASDSLVREEIEVFRRKWLYYFCYCEIGFTSRLLGDHILTFTREGNVDFQHQVFD